MSVVQQPVEHRGGEGRVAGEGLVPLGEAEVTGEDQAAALVALGDDLEEQVGLLATQSTAVMTQVLMPAWVAA